MDWTGMALVALIRLSAAATLMLFLYPRLLLPPRPHWDGWERTAAAGMVGLTLVVAAAHLLVPLRLFELLGLALLMAALALAALWLKAGEARVRRLARWPLAFLLSAIDLAGDRGARGRGLASLVSRSRQLWAQLVSRLSWRSAALAALGLGVAAILFYSRMTDALTHAAPTTSDYLEHLQWTKWLTLPQYGLFFDVVYPRGSHAVAAALRFLTQEEPHLALRVTGPLLNLLLAGGVGFLVRRTTGSTLGALVAAGLFAAAPAWVPADWSRQAGVLPQEFGALPLLPALWWAWRYLEEGDHLDLALAACAALTVALSHWLVLLYLAVGYGAALLSAAGASGWAGRALRLCLASGSAALVGLAPQGLAFWRGVPLLETAAGFAAGDARSLVPPLGLAAWALLAAGLGGALLGVRGRRSHRLIPLVALLFLALMQAPRLGLPSPALATRGSDFLGLALAALVGAGFAGVERVAGAALRGWAGIAAAGALIALFWLTAPPRAFTLPPEIPDEMAEQVLVARRQFGPGGWLAAGRPELQALVLGGGLQIDADRFVAAFPVPQANRSIGKALVASGLLGPGAREEDAPDLLLFVEPSPFVSDASRATGREPALIRMNDALLEWIGRFRRERGEPEVHFSSPALTIYRIPAGGR